MSSIFNQKYIEVTYKDKKTDYPIKFCKHLIDSYKIPKGSKILDIGCGDASFSEAFQKLGMKVTGIDISDAGDDKIISKLMKHDLTIKPYPLLSGSFDYAFSKSVVEHLREPNILIDEAYRLLKSGGMFLCLTPSWKHSYEEAFYIDHTHVTPFTRVSLETACELSGFDSDCDYLYQLPLLWKYPFLHIGRRLLNLLSLPYRPFSKAKWSDDTNKIIRFSKEAMLICKAVKK
jgi:SAM-dependent methyltransferase